MSLEDFFARPALDVAADLLGRRIVHRAPAGLVAVRLTEVEAYAGAEDPGSHAFRGPTPRTAVMFGPPGHLYVYFSYGLHWCVNLVCGPPGTASAVLLRAGEVVEGHALARSRRRSASSDRDLARGPARLAAALGLDGSHDGTALGGCGCVWVSASPEVAVTSTRTGPRVGVSGPGGDGGRFPWRLWLDEEPTVSAYRPAVVGTKQPRRGGATPSGTLGTGSPGVRRAGETEGPP